VGRRAIVCGMENRWRGFLQLGFGIALFGLFFYMMAPFLVPILLGGVLAIICYPLFSQLSRKIPGHLSSLIITLATVIGILLPLALVSYTAAHRILQLSSRLKVPTNGGSKITDLLNHPFLQKALQSVERFFPIDKSWIQDQALSVLQTVLEKLSSFMAGFLSSMPGLLLGMAITIVSFYFLLVDGERFLRFLGSLSFMKQEKAEELYQTFESSCRGVVVGLFASAAAQGILAIFFYAITGIPDPILLGSITAILAMVPLFGSTPITIGAFVYLFLQGKIFMGIIMTIGAIIIGISDNVIRPAIMKGASQMHPLLALVSVFGAIQLLGATGIFLGPVIAAVFVAFLKMTSVEIKREKTEAPSPHYEP